MKKTAKKVLSKSVLKKKGNFNYRSGRYFEYRVKKYFDDKGYLTFRMAGSHSCADIIAISNAGIPHLIQCKTSGGGMTEKERKAFVLKVHKFNCVAILAYKEKRKLVFGYLGDCKPD